MQVFIRPVVIIASIVILIWSAFSLLRLNTTAIHTQAALVMDGLALTPMFKVAVAEHYQRYGRLPLSNEEARLLPRQEYAKGALESVAIGERGIVTLHYNEKSGINGSTIQMVPVVNERGGMIHWKCQTSSFPLIEKFAPQCRYLEIQP